LAAAEVAASAFSPEGLPRIAVISDVAVERTGAGSLLLYRLLEKYPRDRLRIFYPPAQSRGEDVRIPGAEYIALPYKFPRAIANRFDPFAPVLCSLLVQREARPVLESLGSFRPDCVLSVAHGYLWFTAAAVADSLGVPLHLFLHEEWPNLVTHNRKGVVWDVVRTAARARARSVYHRASGRFSVSRGMVDEMERTYGIASTLIYPNRGDDSPVPRVRVRPEPSKTPVVAHTGFLHFEGNRWLLQQTARMAGELGGHLDLYTMHSAEQLANWGLPPPVVRNVGFFPAHEMGERVASTADALLLTGSFDDKDRIDASTLFPSKLADYTAIGLPIITWAPAYSSAARWSAETGGALLFTDRDPAPVRAALVRLQTDRAFAAEVAKRGVEAGKRDFELSVARDRFFGALRSAKSTP
jgi:hypothetical protein